MPCLAQPALCGPPVFCLLEDWHAPQLWGTGVGRSEWRDLRGFPRCRFKLLSISSLFPILPFPSLLPSFCFPALNSNVCPCRNQVAVLGGQIGAMSKQGLGSTFWFTVPLLPPKPLRPRSSSVSSAGPLRRTASWSSRDAFTDGHYGAGGGDSGAPEFSCT